jgi:integrase
LREAAARRDWIAGELAAMRVPDIRLASESTTLTVRIAAERWRVSRVDVSEGTSATHRVNLGRIVPRLGRTAVDALTASDVAIFVGELHGEGLARESIRKTLATLAMVLDHAGVSPNPARDRRTVKLPHEVRGEVTPPTAAHVLAVHHVLPAAYRLPLLVLDATGMRVGELEGLTWGDVDETSRRWRVSASVSKTSRARWVPVPEEVFEAVSALVAREDRTADRPVFQGFGADRFRTALARACTPTSGVPAFSPHGLRHRRATLWHLGGVPAAEAAAWLGHSAQEHLKTYAHATLSDRSEVDYGALLASETERTVIRR